MTDKQKARIALSKGGAIKDISSRYKISANTLKLWRKRMRRKCEVVPQVIPAKPQWMQSIHHESAHLVDHQGRAACDDRIMGIIGVHWQPHDLVKKCRRCMGAENKNAEK